MTPIGDDQCITYVVRQGDHLRNIAFRHGVPADTLWNHERNARLRSIRGTGDMLVPGDILHIPKQSEQRLAIHMGATNRYRAKLSTITLDTTFHDAQGRPIANEQIELHGMSERPDAPRTTDATGRLVIEVPITAPSLDVVFPKRNLSFTLHVGHLDPPDTVSGTWQRLKNLGLGGHGQARLSPGRLANAIATLEGTRDLAPTGDLNEDTRDIICERHGR